MKKLIGIIFLLIISIFAGYFIYINYLKDKGIIPEEEKVNISEYYIYGDHLNIKGTLEIEDMTYQKVCLSLYDGKNDKDIDIITSNDGKKLNFNFSEYINDGFRLRILSAAGNSSQSGKLSFWTCEVTAPDNRTFNVGVNSELMCELICSSCFINGN